MVNISEEAKNEYLKDTSHKNLFITVDDEPGNITNINWYIWHFSRTGAETAAIFSFFTAWHDEINQQYLRYADYLYLSCRVKYNGNREDLNGKHIRIFISNATGNEYVVNFDEGSNKWATDAFMDGTLRIYNRIDKEEIPKFCQPGDPEYGGLYPGGYVQLYNDAQNANLTIDEIQLQCEFESYNFNDLYPTSNRTNYKLPYLGYNSFASNNTITAIVRRPATSLNPVTNSNIARESLRLSESICSKDKLKIGSSEAAILEIALIDRFEKFNGRYIRPYIATKEFADNAEDFEYKEINWIKGVRGYYQPNSTFTAAWSNGNLALRFPLTAENRIGETNSKYINKGNYVAVRYKFKISTFESEVVPVYINAGLGMKFEEATYLFGDHFDFSDAQNDFLTYTIILEAERFGGIIGLDRIVFLFEDENKDACVGTAKIGISIKEIQFCILDKNNSLLIPAYNSNACIEWRNIDVDKYIYERQRGIIDKYAEPIDAIPLGRFLITDTTVKSARTYKRNELIGYDDIYNLSVNASNWFKMYAFGINLDGYTGGGYEYTRQMYSAYWNIMSALMLDSRKNHKEELVYSEVIPHYKNSTIPKPGGGYYGAISKSWEVGEGDPQGWFFEHLWYGEVNINVAEQAEDFIKHPLVFDIWYQYALNYHYDAQQSYHYVYSSYRNFNDPYGRGIYNRACVLVKETLENGTTNKFCVDNGDYFMLSPNCVSFSIYYPCTQYPHADNAGVYQFLGGNEERPGVQLHSVVDMSPDFVNAATRLVYYNYETREISDSDSSITARDVIRSLLEINGCFLHCDRDGNIKPVYCTKEGLYPAAHLYPSEDLYPSGNNTRMPTSLYIKSDYADYVTKEYGKIQIRKMSGLSNDDENVVQWEYIGDIEFLNTYVIDDNVFYSGNNMVYNKEGMPEVDRMLQNLYSKITNLTYTPNVTRAVGLPWLEAGDRIGIMTSGGGFESFIFRRTMNGIQVLRDTLESYGEEVEKSVDAYAINTYTDTPISPYHT